MDFPSFMFFFQNLIVQKIKVIKEIYYVLYWKYYWVSLSKKKEKKDIDILMINQRLIVKLQYFFQKNENIITSWKQKKKKKRRKLNNGIQQIWGTIYSLIGKGKRKKRGKKTQHVSLLMNYKNKWMKRKIKRKTLMFI